MQEAARHMERRDDASRWREREREREMARREESGRDGESAERAVRSDAVELHLRQVAPAQRLACCGVQLEPAEVMRRAWVGAAIAGSFTIVGIQPSIAEGTRLLGLGELRGTWGWDESGRSLDVRL